MREAVIERYLVKRVIALGGEVRKVQWIGRRGAPDRLVMLPGNNRWPLFPVVAFVELKSPETIKTFPANAHERQQAREHARMRRMEADVRVIGTIEQVDAWLG